ncbi:hypothetical protein [Sphingobium cloacae]|uniref:hypothetical protein n=1 Tax=Sphingobium cloacae TaxID=120107 RepID=UPI000830DF51|nr:hypothetical protein [Sphingobium cloacae]
MRRWAFNLLGAWSQFWNAFWGGNRDQSFSSRSFEAAMLGRPWGRWAVRIIDGLFWFQPNHCARAFFSDGERTYRDPSDLTPPIKLPPEKLPLV